MGLSTDALLFFGYCAEDEEELFLPGEDEHDDWENVVIARFGLEYPDVPREDNKDVFREFWAKKKKLLEEIGVTYDSHCSIDYPMRLIAVTRTLIRAYRGSPAKPENLDVTEEDRAKLATFCEKVGISPGVEPRWWLASDMG